MSPRTTRTLPLIEPVVPVLGSPPLHERAWLYEPKVDGFRGVLYLHGRECYIRSKRGNVLRRFGELAQRLRAELSVRDAILDGEVVAVDDEGRMDFRALLAGRGWLHLVALTPLRCGSLGHQGEGVEALPRYMRLDMPGKVRHVQASQLEFLDDSPV